MDWTKDRSARETLEIIGTLSDICASQGGVVAKRINTLLKAKRYTELVNYDLDYGSINATDAIYSRQILGFVQKLDALDLGIDRDAVARSRFAESEERCLQTNRRLKSHLHSLERDAVNPILHRAQRKISEILGDLPNLEDLTPQFGSGANINVKSAVACPRAKLSALLQCSYEMLPTVDQYLYEVPGWVALHAQCENESSYIVDVAVAPGKLTFVPKNAKTSRSIVIEPLLNGFFQKGYGSYIRNRLLRFGLNLRDQTRNQQLAKIGSIDGSLATLDLSMASDCLSYELVWNLLPTEWCEVLCSLRSGYVSVDADVATLLGRSSDPSLNALVGEGKFLHRLEKFSSMGNGFTFELESLIFYALAFATCAEADLPLESVSVYGDDIIIPTAAYSQLTKVLNFCGFEVNSSKSFAEGPFRESCGADFLVGVDIRPFYLKTLISDRILYTMHNYFMRAGERELATACEQKCSQPTLKGPDGYGDGHLIGSYELRSNRSARRAGWCGGTFDTYTLKARRFCKPLPGDAVLPCYSVYTRSGERDATDPDIVRGSNGYAKVSIYTLAVSIFARF